VGLFSRRNKRNDVGVVVHETWPDEATSGFVVLDLETTGLSPVDNRVIEIGLIRTDAIGNPLGYWSSLINPQQRVTASHIHGITDDDVKSAPTFDDCVGEVLKRLKGQVLVAHNASFDVSFMRSELARTGWELPEVPTVCTMLESRYFLPGLSSKRLGDCAQAIGIDQDVQHRALGDASLATAIFHFYLNGPTNRSRSNQLRQLPTTAQTVVWPKEKSFPVVPVRNKKITNSNFASKPPTNSELFERVSQLMPEDLLSDQASAEEISYGELLLRTLEDGVIVNTEVEALKDCAAAMRLSEKVINEIHKTLLIALAQEAWRDGTVNRNESREIVECAKLLGLPEADGKEAINAIDKLRSARVAARSQPLPDGWALGEPLRVGDRIVITGCYEVGRYDMEKRARALGVRITSAVSGRTTMLVSDGTINGNKDEDAKRLAIRVCNPTEFNTLLDHIQPAADHGIGPSGSGSRNEQKSVSPKATENLVCTKCANTFTRQVAKGRKPHLCESCRQAN
jgi:DNA polymerase-3 subunit epsilon